MYLDDKQNTDCWIYKRDSSGAFTIPLQPLTCYDDCTNEAISLFAMSRSVDFSDTLDGAGINPAKIDEIDADEIQQLLRQTPFLYTALAYDFHKLSPDPRRFSALINRRTGELDYESASLLEQTRGKILHIASGTETVESISVRFTGSGEAAPEIESAVGGQFHSESETVVPKSQLLSVPLEIKDWEQESISVGNLEEIIDRRYGSLGFTSLVESLCRLDESERICMLPSFFDNGVIAEILSEE